MAKARLGITVEGGIIRSIYSDDPAMVGVAVQVIDYDCEGGDDRMMEVRQKDGDWEPAIVSEWEVERHRIPFGDDFRDFHSAA